MSQPDFDIDAAIKLMTGEIARQSLSTNAYHPVSEQYAITEEDYVSVMASGAPIDADFVIGQVINPEAHATQFPDWESRVQGVDGPACLLVLWKSNKDPFEQLGWFSRSKLIPVTTEEFEQLDKELTTEEVPDWMKDRYAEFTSRVYATSQGINRRQATCGECGSHRVEIHAIAVYHYCATAVEGDKDGELHYFPATQLDEPGHDMSGHLHCLDCNAEAEFEHDDLHNRVHLGGLFAD